MVFLLALHSCALNKSFCFKHLLEPFFQLRHGGIHQERNPNTRACSLNEVVVFLLWYASAAMESSFPKV